MISDVLDGVEVATSKSAPVVSENILTDTLSGVWYGVSEEKLTVEINGTDGEGNEIDWINELGHIVPIKEKAMMWFISKALNGGELLSQQAYTFRLNEDENDRETLWVDYCNTPSPEESVAIKLTGNLMSIATMEDGKGEAFEHMLMEPWLFFMPNDEVNEIPEAGPVPVEVVNNSHILFDEVSRSHTISRPLSEFEFSDTPSRPVEPPERPPVAAVDIPVPDTEVKRHRVTRKITPDMMLNITISQTINRQWVKIKNASSDVLGVASYGDKGFDVGCFYIMQANTSGNLTGIVDMDVFEYGIASTDQKSEWVLSEANHSFILPDVAENNRFASFKMRTNSDIAYTPEEVAEMESLENSMRNELDALSREYMASCFDQQFNYPQKPIFDPNTGGPVMVPLPIPGAITEDPIETMTLSKEECTVLRTSIDDLQQRLFETQMVLEKILYGENEFFSTEWGTLSFDTFDAEGDVHNIEFKTYSPHDNAGEGGNDAAPIAPIAGRVVLKLSP